MSKKLIIADLSVSHKILNFKMAKLNQKTSCYEREVGPRGDVECINICIYATLGMLRLNCSQKVVFLFY